MTWLYIVMGLAVCLGFFAAGFWLGRRDGYDEAEEVYQIFYGIPKARRK